MRTADPTDPINALYAEHDVALQHLRTLGSTGREIGQKGASPDLVERFTAAMTFLDTEVRTHNEFEEQQLFPRMEAAMGPGGPCAVMRAEHRTLWDHYASLAPLLASARKGSAGKAEVEGLARIASAVEQLLTDHITKENDILFPMARNVLSAQDIEEMRAARAASRA